MIAGRANQKRLNNGILKANHLAPSQVSTPWGDGGRGLWLVNNFPGSADVSVCSPWVEEISQVDHRTLINMYIDKHGWLKSMHCHYSSATEIEMHHV